MRKRLLITALTVAFSLSLGTAAPALTITGTASGTPSGTGFAGVGTVSGSFSLFFDESVVVGVGSESFTALPLTSLTLSPDPLGTTVFSTANSLGRLDFLDGILVTVIVGGSANGAGTLGVGTDDFRFVFSGSPLGSSVSVSALTTTDSGVGHDFSATGSINVVPEPMSALLLATGLTALAWRVRREMSA